MSEHNDPKKTDSSASTKDADRDDFLDSTDDLDGLFGSREQSFDQQHSYDPLADDLFAQGNTVMFNEHEKQAKRSKWMIIGGVVLVAVALILALKLLSGTSDEPQIQTPPAPVQTQPEAESASALDSEELALLPTQIEVPMPATQQQAEEQIDAFTGEQELLEEQMAMYEEQLATSQKLSELKAAQIAALEKQLSQQTGGATDVAPNGARANTPAASEATAADPAQPSVSASTSAVEQP